MITRNVIAGLVLACCVAVGCTQSEPAPASGADSGAPDAATAEGRTVLSGPTLIAFYPLGTPGEEPDEDLGESLDDFSHHLSAARDSLRALGFTIETQAVDSTRIVQDTLGVAFQLPGDSADIGYYFAAPGRPPMIVYGVRTSTEIVQRARDFMSGKP